MSEASFPATFPATFSATFSPTAANGGGGQRTDFFLAEDDRKLAAENGQTFVFEANNVN